MRAPNSVVSIKRVDSADFASEVAPRCGELLHAIIDNQFTRAMGPHRLGELQRFVAFNKHGMILVAMAEGKVIGSGCAAYDSRKLLIDCAVKRFWLFLPAAMACLKSASAIVHFFRTINYGKHDFMQDLPDAEFIYMNIDEEYRGTGVSDDMLDLVCAEFAAVGITRFKGMTSEHNARATGWAKAHGARIVDEANLYPERLSRVLIIETAEIEKSKRRNPPK